MICENANFNLCFVSQPCGRPFILTVYFIPIERIMVDRNIGGSSYNDSLIRIGVTSPEYAFFHCFDFCIDRLQLQFGLVLWKLINSRSAICLEWKRPIARLPNIRGFNVYQNELPGFGHTTHHPQVWNAEIPPSTINLPL